MNPNEIKKIAHLARLAIAAEDLPDYARDLTAILHLAEEMQTINTEGIAPLAHPLDMLQRLRPDTVSETDQREHYQTLAPEVEAGLYLVPKVIE